MPIEIDDGEPEACLDMQPNTEEKGHHSQIDHSFELFWQIESPNKER